MTSLLSLGPDEEIALARWTEPRRFAAGERLVRQGDPSDGCFFIVEGTVRLEVAIEDFESDGVLGFLDAGSSLGELSFFEDSVRSASAFAETAVTTAWLSVARFKEMASSESALALKVLRGLGLDLSRKLRAMNQRVAANIASGAAPGFLDAVVQRATAAQLHLAAQPLGRLAVVAEAVGRAVAESAAALGARAVSDTGIGDAADKAALIEVIGTQWSLASRAHGLPSPSRPIGVVAALLPATQPTSMFLALVVAALRSQNALILAPHRRVVHLAEEVSRRVRAVLADHGLPSDAVQVLSERPSRRTTMQLLGHPGVACVLASGGVETARAALGLGKPVVALGRANTPLVVGNGADLSAAARALVRSRAFDAGLLSGAEDHAVVVRSAVDAFIVALEQNGARVLRGDDGQRFVAALSRPDGAGLKPQTIGQSANRLLEMAGLGSHPEARVVVVPVARDQIAGALGGEKLCPVVSFVVADDDNDALQLASALVERGGVGHTVSVFGPGPALAQAAAARLRVVRVLDRCCIADALLAQPDPSLQTLFWAGGTATGNVVSTPVTAAQLRERTFVLGADPGETA